MRMNDDQLADRAAAAGDYRTALDHLARAKSADAQPSLARALKMAAMARALGDTEAASVFLHQALAINPLDVSALLLKATMLHNAGDPNAGDFYGRALAQIEEPAPPHLAAVLHVARQRHVAWQTETRARLIERVRSVAPVTPALCGFIDALLHLAPPEREGPSHYCYPGLATAGFHPRDRFAWLTRLEDRVATIQQELAAILQVSTGSPYIRYPEHVPVDQWHELNGNADWSAIHLIERGVVTDLARRYCPETVALVQSLPQPVVAGIGPNAMFSLLAPHTHIPPHTGVSNTRLICHLPLVTPPECWFRVGAETRLWHTGEAWVFDDTIEHEAMNPSEHMRAALIFDVWHPDLDEDARRAVGAIMEASGALHAL